jgi:hypothetical protein
LVSGSATWMARPGASWVVSTMARVPAMLVMASKGCAWPAATSIAASLGVSRPLSCGWAQTAPAEVITWV